MQKYQSIISGTNGSVIRNVPVTVLKEDGSPAEIFLDREGQVPAPNPLATDSRGVFYFYAKNGRYSLRTSVDGITITDADAVLLNDPEEITTAGPIADAVLRAEAAAQRAEEAVEASGIPELVGAAQNAVLDANAALQGAQSAAQLADDAKAQAASAKNAAELAQQASDTAKTGAENARSLAEQAADQARVYAESIDPAQFVQKEAGKGLMTEGERTKLSGIAEQATKNAADDALRDRSTHSGTQGMETITGLSAALDARVVETAATGAALLPSGTTAQRPDPTLHPSDLLVRGNTDTGKPEWYNHEVTAWKKLVDEDQLAVVDAAVQSLDAAVQSLDSRVDFTIIYPNGGTEAAPALASPDSRYVNENPFSGHSVIVRAEILQNGAWADPGWCTSSGSIYGVSASQRNLTGDIVTQVGLTGAVERSSWGGGGHGITVRPTGSPPVRVLVWKV